jgi:membrane fusion protein (multidrug efflux system)
MSEIHHRFAVTLAACLFALGASACSKAPPPPAPPPPQVQLAEVKSQSIQIIMDFSGTVAAVRAIDIIPRVGGYLMKRHYVEGKTVEEGAPLYTIDPRTYQADLDSAEAQLERDKANLEFFRSELKRYNQAAATNAVSQQQVDAVREKMLEASAAVDMDAANIESSQLQLGFTEIAAPFKGRIEQSRIDEGELLTAHRDVLTSLVQLDPIQVDFTVSRRQVASIQKLHGKNLIGAPETFVGQIVLADGEVYKHQGKIDFVSAQIDPTTDSLMARLVVENPAGDVGHMLIPGQYVPVRLIVGKRDALLVPQTAVIEIQGGSQVYTLDKDNKVTATPVTLGPAEGDQIVIETGLTAGDRVISDGTSKVRPGMPVTPVKAGAKTGSKTAPKKPGG